LAERVFCNGCGCPSFAQDCCISYNGKDICTSCYKEWQCGRTVPIESEIIRHKFLLHLVDVVWGEAHEDKSVPSSEWAERMIAKAKDTFC
jgi:hypothetical protein